CLCEGTAEEVIINILENVDDYFFRGSLTKASDILGKLHRLALLVCFDKGSFQIHVSLIHWNGSFQKTALIGVAFLDIVSIENCRKVVQDNAMSVSDNIDIIIALKFVEQFRVMCGKNQHCTGFVYFFVHEKMD